MIPIGEVWDLFDFLHKKEREFRLKNRFYLDQHPHSLRLQDRNRLQQSYPLAT